jgi:hypothetical protein
MRYFLLALIVVTVLVTGLWLVSRSLPASQAQREALALLETPPTFEGSNAFTALWLLPYDVPEAEHNAAMTADIEAHVRNRTKPLEDQVALLGHSLAAEQYANLRPEGEDRDLFCRSGRVSCLDQVRADPDSVRSLVARHARLLERIAALADHDHVQILFPPDFMSPTPGFQLTSYIQTEHALAFVDGRVGDALEGTCRDLATWQRLGTNTDTLLMRMIGQAFAGKGYAELLADMLAELPPGHPLPHNCQGLLRPPEPEALNMCQPMRGEFQLLQAGLREIGSGFGPLVQPDEVPWSERMRLKAFRYEPSIALAAPHYAQWCSDDIRDAVAADNPAPELLDQPGRFNLRCLANLYGCWMVGITTPAFAPYHAGHLDHGARMRALAAVLWLQQHATEQSLEAAFVSLPDELQSATRPLRLEFEHARLSVELHHQSEGQYFTLPLPGSRRHGGPSADSGRND